MRFATRRLIGTVTVLLVVLPFLSAAPSVRAADPPALAPVPVEYRPGFETITERKIRAWIAFLASAGGAYITGQNIRVDGGITRSV